MVLLPKLGIFNGGLVTGGQTAPTATAQAVPTATTGTAAQPTATPRAQPTPSNTTPPCQVFMQGSASNVNVDLSDINLDGSGPATTQNTSSHIRYSQLPSPIFKPVTVSAIHDVGIGANYGALGCSQLTGFSYGGGTVPFTDAEVFAVKTQGGHYAKVRVSKPVGGPPTPTIQWVTYKP